MFSFGAKKSKWRKNNTFISNGNSNILKREEEEEKLRTVRMRNANLLADSYAYMKNSTVPLIMYDV